MGPHSRPSSRSNINPSTRVLLLLPRSRPPRNQRPTVCTATRPNFAPVVSKANFHVAHLHQSVWDLPLQVFHLTMKYPSLPTDTAITPEYPVLATESPNYIAGNTSFCLDSASTAHIIRHRELFTTYDDSSHERIIGSTGHTLDAQGRGSVRIAVTLHGTRKFITLSECLHVPAASTNIVSLPKWLEKGGEFVGKGESITLKFKSRDRTVCFS